MHSLPRQKGPTLVGRRQARKRSPESMVIRGPPKKIQSPVDECDLSGVAVQDQRDQVANKQASHAPNILPQILLELTVLLVV